jgi:hypothetical protein
MIRNKQISQGESVTVKVNYYILFWNKHMIMGKYPLKYPLQTSSLKPPIRPVLPLAKLLLVVSSLSYPGHHNNSTPGPTLPRPHGHHPYNSVAYNYLQPKIIY